MNKYIKYGLSLVAIIFSLNITMAVLANGFHAPAPCVMPYFDGPYVGVGIGVLGAYADVESESNHIYIENDIHQFNNNKSQFYLFRNFNLGRRGGDANVFVGYGRTLNLSYYLGGELFGHYFRIAHESSSNETGVQDIGSSVHFIYPLDTSVKIKNPYSFGGDLRAGYLVSAKTMLYILFGLDYSKFKIESESSFLATGGIPYPHETISDSFTQWRVGYFPGVGIETGLTDHVSLRAEYTHTFYSSFSNTVTRSEVNYHGSLRTKVKPSRGLFTVKLSYLFN